MPRLLVAHNPVYWPSIGGSERVLQHIVEGVRPAFDHVVVFAESVEQRFFHNDVEVRPYRELELRRFFLRERPDVYFPNMVHNRITIRNLAWGSRFSGRTVLNVIGGYFPGTPFWRRLRLLRRAAARADVVVHVDPLSTEWLVDQVLAPSLPVVFIPQGLEFDELDAVRREHGGDYFVHAHNLWRWKRPDVFLRSIAGQLPELQFKIIASDVVGDHIAETRALASRFPNVDLELGLPRRGFIETIAGAAAVISTSSTEGAQPNIMLEAGALGVPYLSVPPGQNFAHYEHVEMFPDVESLTERLRGTGPDIRPSKIPELRRAMTRFSRGTYGWPAVIERYLAVFIGPLSGLELMSRPPSATPGSSP